MLINDILDLSKIESGTVIVDVGEVPFRDLQRLRATAPSGTWPRTRSWNSMSTSPRAVPRSMQTDAKRLQQILKNLLSNAFKFTEKGRVSLRGRAGHAGLECRQRIAQQVAQR